LTLRLVSAPAAEPVSLADFKGHLNLDNPTAPNEQDGDLALKLAGATEYVAGYLRRCLVTTTYDLRLACWPDRAYLDIPLGNLQSVTHIKYTDSAGVEHTVDPATYKLAHVYTPADPNAVPPVVGDGTLDAGIGRLCLAYGASWPSATLDTGEPIVIRFTCGWDADSVPKPIVQRILMLAKAHYTNRDAFLAGDGAKSVAEIALCGERLTSQFEDRRW
jgi:uncharacterized phiE125 gp8 family phage protein